MEMVESRQEGFSVVALTGRVDSGSAPALKDGLCAIMQSGCRGVIVDFKQVAYISSAGFKALLIAAREADGRGCGLALCGIEGDVHRMFEIGAFAQVFTILATREECLQRLGAAPADAGD